MGESEVTRLLTRGGHGRAAADDLMRIVYDDLHALAQRAMARERPSHTLQPTALIHEAYLHLIGRNRTEWRGRGHFFAACAEAIPRILIDHARTHGARKRHSNGARVPLDQGGTLPGGSPVSIDHLALAEALDELGRLSERQARVVKLRFFGGLSVKEIAEVIGVSDRTVKGDWRVARAWLIARLDR